MNIIVESQPICVRPHTDYTNKNLRRRWRDGGGGMVVGETLGNAISDNGGLNMRVA